MRPSDELKIAKSLYALLLVHPADVLASMNHSHECDAPTSSQFALAFSRSY